jgi:hypothetical protein
MRSDKLAAGFTVSDLCARWRIGADKIRLLIRTGRLKAINTAMSDCGKPRFVILPEEVTRFETARSATPPPRKRRRRNMKIVDFYPD